MRLVAIIGLVFSLLVLGESALQSWRITELPNIPEVSQKRRVSPVPERQAVAVNPHVPALMPDLNTGYLFNKQRSNTAQGGEDATSGGPASLGSSPVDMDTLVYAGSIIIDNLRRGMVSFSLKSGPGVPADLHRLPGRRPMVARPTPKAGMQYATVNQGDDFYGFKVASVQPDKIIFVKSGTQIKKMLYDPNKKRTVSAQSNSRTPATAWPANERAGRRPLPGQTGVAEHTLSTERRARGVTPVPRNPRLRGTVIRRPPGIQLRRLPAQTR